MDHISSQFKNELQKKYGGGSLILSREFVTQFSAKCHHNFCVEKTLEKIETVLFFHLCVKSGICVIDAFRTYFDYSTHCSKISFT